MFFFHKWPDVQYTTSRMMFSHWKQNWKNVTQKQSFAGVLQNRCSKNFANLTGDMLESLFEKVAGLRHCNIIKKRLQHSCFPVKFEKFLRTPFFTEHLRWLLLVISLTPYSLSWVNRPFRLTQLATFLKQPIIYGFIDDKNKEALITKFFRLS